MTMNHTIVILAAGSAKRFGKDKRQALLADGTPLLQRSTAQALASSLPVLVCLRPEDAKMASTLQNLGARTLLCPQAHRGMGHTLAAGLERASNGDGVLIALGDMPYIQPASYRTVAQALKPGAIVVPEYRGSTGHPVGFSRAFYAELAAVAGDQGARQVIEQNEHAVVRVSLSDAGIHADIDTPEDIRQS